MNKVILIGRHVRDVELKKTQSNISVVSFSLAVDRQYKDENGERGVDYFDFVAWRSLADNISTYCHKGDRIAVEGHLTTRQYEVDGNKRKTVEIVCDSVQFLESKQEWNNEEARQVQRSYDDAGSKDISNDKPKSDELPF